MVSRLLVDQSSSLGEMMERMKTIGAQTSCKKYSIPKGEQGDYQRLHEEILHKHAMTSTTLQHWPPPEGNVPVRLSQTVNSLCQGKLEHVGISLSY